MMPDSLLKQLQNAMPHYCDKCGTKHSKDDFEIVSSGNNRATCKLNCRNCGNTYMIQASVPAEGVVSAKKSELKTELTIKEMNKFMEAESIGTDEIIGVHDKLKGSKTMKDFLKIN